MRRATLDRRGRLGPEREHAQVAETPPVRQDEARADGFERDVVALDVEPEGALVRASNRELDRRSAPALDELERALEREALDATAVDRDDPVAGADSRLARRSRLGGLDDEPVPPGPDGEPDPRVALGGAVLECRVLLRCQVIRERILEAVEDLGNRAAGEHRRGDAPVVAVHKLGADLVDDGAAACRAGRAESGRAPSFALVTPRPSANAPRSSAATPAMPAGRFMVSRIASIGRLKSGGRSSGGPVLRIFLRF